MLSVVSMPRLESLTIVTSEYTMGTPVLVQGCTSTLRRLSTLSFCAPLNAPILATLRSLRLTAAYEGIELSSQQWYNLLDGAPRLEYICALGSQHIARRTGPFQTFSVHLPISNK
ncbi:hypothetical protein FRC02_007030 [Tulasnella sp. 418]|nr:hypothetical protein FRC02_007030 [Tulasnella sp. 418]